MAHLKQHDGQPAHPINGMHAGARVAFQSVFSIWTDPGWICSLEAGQSSEQRASWWQIWGTRRMSLAVMAIATSQKK